MKILAVIGIILLVILAVFLILFAFLSFTKFRIVFEILRAGDKQELFLSVYFWNNNVRIPLIKRTSKDEKKERRKKAKKEKPRTSEGKAESFMQKINSYVDLYNSLKKPTLTMLKRVRETTVIEPVTLYINFGATDPAKTGMVYGALQATINPALSILSDAFNINPIDFKFNPDFNNERFDVYFHGIISLRFVHIIMGLISIAIAYFRSPYRKNKKAL